MMREVDFSTAGKFDSFVVSVYEDGWAVVGKRPDGTTARLAWLDQFKAASQVKVFFEAHRDAQREGR